MIIKKASDQVVVQSATCGEVHEILQRGEYGPFSVAILFQIKPTTAHFHLTFDETYFVLDGEITIELYDPISKKRSTLTLQANELCVITKGIHHKVIKASEQNRLCVIASPPFVREDEHPSDILNS